MNCQANLSLPEIRLIQKVFEIVDVEIETQMLAAVGLAPASESPPIGNRNKSFQCHYNHAIWIMKVSRQSSVCVKLP